MTNVYFFGFMASLLISMALLPPLRATARHLHFLDLPNERKVHTAPIAKIGGLAFATATIITLLLWAPKDDLVTGILFGGTIILLFGAWDDRANLGYQMKLLGQVLAAGLVVWIGGVRLSNLPLLEEGAIPSAILIPLTMLFVVGATNAVNLADGLDGLAGGLSLLSFGAIAYLAYLSGDTVLTLLILCLLGGLLGFMRFNTYPARIFMGDAGSQYLGFHLAVFALVLTDTTRNPYSPALIGLLLGLPLLDTAGVFVQRLIEGRSPFAADKNHLHHRLLGLGLAHHEAVVVIYVLQACLVGLAVAFRWRHDAVVLGTYVASAAVILTIYVVKTRLSILDSFHALRAKLTAGLKTLEENQWISGIPIRALATLIPAFLVVSVIVSPPVPSEVGYLGFGVCCLVGGGLWLLPRQATRIVRTSLYVGTIFLMFVNEPRPGVSLMTPVNVFLGLIAILVIIAIRFGEGHRFHTTPLDYLMVFLALATTALPGMQLGHVNVGLLVAKIIVLLFSFELLLHAFSKRLVQLALLSLWVAGGLCVRAFL